MKNYNFSIRVKIRKKYSWYVSIITPLIRTIFTFYYTLRVTQISCFFPLKSKRTSSSKMGQNHFHLFTCKIYPISMNKRSKQAQIGQIHGEQSKLHPTDKKIDDTLSLIFVSFGKQYLSYIKFWFSDISPFFYFSFFLSLSSHVSRETDLRRKRELESDPI